MKGWFRILMMAGLLLLAANAVFAQKPTRITFAKGATTVIVTGRLNNYKQQKVYVVRVRQGQTLSTERVGENYITVGLSDPAGNDPTDSDLSCHSNHTVENASAGDYTITVYECMKADPWRGTFRLRLRIK